MVKIPEKFQNRIKIQFGNDSEQFLTSLENSPVISVRKNPKKITDLWIDNEKVPWCNEGYYLSQKPIFTLDPLFHAGCYYPQEASSMVVDWILRQIISIPDNPIVLDLCAAPGGKSTLLASWMDGKGLLVANEIIRNRSIILLENMVKWGYPNCVVTQNSPSDFSPLRHFFDIILVDAPCSGEGMFRKEKRAAEEWSESNAAMCAVRQRKILDEIWGSLKPGGILIYSTCTFNPSENEENIACFAKDNQAEVLRFAPPETWGIKSIEINDGAGLAFYPHLVKGEGFFITVIRKQDDEEYQPLTKKEKTINLLKKYLNTMEYGVKIGGTGQKEIIPSQALAMSTDFRNNGFFPEIELNLKEALNYLKGNILPSSNKQKGYVLLTYKGIPLGFGKEIGSRINNLYPAGWRIRMGIN